MSRKTIEVMSCATAIAIVLLLTGCSATSGHQDSQAQIAQGEQLPAVLTNKTVRVTDLPMLGDAGATLALIEVTDYQCPFCQAHYREVFPRLKREFIDTGRLNYYVLDYPLPGHEFAALAATAASCAGDQQTFWPFHDALFERSNLQGDRLLTAIAEDLDLDLQEFEDCLIHRRYDLVIDRRRAMALGLGVRGTPTFLLGRLSNGRAVTDIATLPGLQTIEGFREIIGRYENPEEAGI